MKGNVSFLFTLLLSIGVNSLIAQEGTNLVNPGQYLYPEFSRGKIGMKTGRALSVMLNYNVVTEKLVFMQKGQIYDLTDYNNVDTVILKGRKFLPIDNVFMEIADSGKYTLLLRHTGRVEDPPRPAAYGGTSEVSSSTYMNNVKLGNEVYRLQNDTTLIIKHDVAYWLKKDENAVYFMNEKQLAKIIPELKDKIRIYVKENRLKFDNPADVTDLIRYCNKI